MKNWEGGHCMSQNSFVHQDICNHLSIHSLILHQSQVAGPTKSEAFPDICSRILSWCGLKVSSHDSHGKTWHIFCWDIFSPCVASAIAIKIPWLVLVEHTSRKVCTKFEDPVLNIQWNIPFWSQIWLIWRNLWHSKIGGFFLFEALWLGQVSQNYAKKGFLLIKEKVWSTIQKKSNWYVEKQKS